MVNSVFLIDCLIAWYSTSFLIWLKIVKYKPTLHQTEWMVHNIWYSSKATWYPRVCCSLKILVWKLHHAFNIWTGTHYICAHIEQIAGVCTHELCTHFWLSFLMELNNNCIYTMNLWILSLYVPIDPWMDHPTEKLLTCSCVQHLIPYCLVCYRLVWRMDPLLAIESPLTSSR